MTPPELALTSSLSDFVFKGRLSFRYIAEWKMEPAVCRVSQYDIVDFDKCKCYKSELDCDAPISGKFQQQEQNVSFKVT